MANLTLFCQIKVRGKWRSVIFLAIVFFLSERKVKRSWALLTANVLGNFVKYMLFTAAYNIKKRKK